MLTVIRHHYYVIVAVVSFAVVLFLSTSGHSFAQQQQAAQGGATNGSNTVQLKNATSPSTPVLEQTSQKGIYKVRITWPQTVIDASRGTQMQIDFLNASAPAATNATVPQRENVSGGSGAASHGSAPGILDSPLSVKSYDMTIYSSDGKVLWKKTNQLGVGGRGSQKIILNNNYTGSATIEISNIQPGWTNANNMVDSVKFTTTIVPEFPIAALMLPLAIGIAATLLAPRLKQRFM